MKIGERVPTQCFCQDVCWRQNRKHGVVIENDHYTEHFRDPKSVEKQGDDYLMVVVGAQTLQNTGSMALLAAKDLMNWQHKGPFKLVKQPGYMGMPRFLWNRQESVGDAVFSTKVCLVKTHTISKTSTRWLYCRRPPGIRFGRTGKPPGYCTARLWLRFLCATDLF